MSKKFSISMIKKLISKFVDRLFFYYQIAKGEFIIYYDSIDSFPKLLPDINRYYHTNIHRIRQQWVKPSFTSLLRVPRTRDFYFFLKHSKELKSIKHVLDIGCGTGEYSLLIRKLFPLSTYTGIETDAGILKIADQNFPQCQFKRDSLMKASSIRHKNDLVILSSVLQYLQQDIPQAIKNIVKITNQYLLVTRFPLFKFYSQNQSLKIKQTVYSKYGKEEHYLVAHKLDYYIDLGSSKDKHIITC